MDTFLLIVAIYVILTVVGAIQKKKKEEARRRQQLMLPLAGPGAAARAAGGTVGAERPAGQLTMLERALAELKRAEEEAQAARQGRVARKPSWAAEEESGSGDYDDETTGDAEEGEEDTGSPEAISLDDESVREVEERGRAEVAAERAAISHVESSAPSRIQSAIVPSIVSAVTAFPQAPEAPEAEGAAPRARRSGGRGPLGRFATGSARDAIVLAEILQRPLGERM